MDSSATSAFDQTLDRETGMEHHLLVDILQAAQQVSFNGSKVGDHETLGDIVGFKQFNQLLETTHDLRVVVSDVEFNLGFGYLTVCLVNLYGFGELIDP
jgi:hypothetical protein